MTSDGLRCAVPARALENEAALMHHKARETVKGQDREILRHVSTNTVNIQPKAGM
jgi:hypothetical protein